MGMAKVTEVCRVKPRLPWPEETISDSSTNLATQYFALTFFDTFWIKFPPTQRIFFYNVDQLSPHHFYHTILPNLKHSLSLTLQHYPSLAGTLSWHPHSAKPVIRYNSPHDGVLFSVAESGAHFDSLATHDFKEARDLHALLPEFPVSETEATVLSLQVTLFPGYGFSIGYCAHHVSMDGVSNAMFLKSWTTTCRLGAHPPELNPLLDRSLIHDPFDLCTFFTDHRMKAGRSLVPMGMDKKLPAPGVIRSTFRLTPKQIGEIKGRIGKGPVSSYIAVCAYVWTCLVRAEFEVGELSKENVYLLVMADCRGRMKPPIPANYFGNCIKYQLAKAEVASLAGGEDGFVAAAEAIKEAIGSLQEGGLLKGAEGWVSEIGSMKARNEKVYGIGASMRFDLYGSDFGWGRPSMAELVSIDKNDSFSLCDGRDGNHVNVEIGIALNKPTMEAFASHFARVLQLITI